ncbi:alpha/beta hydrolase family protein [Dyadobacter diqingensis]|uniref:alpha/beta hydrolase family protein n=1 Tax=Dyadobacter diqingensis TaxID=2938121 RepID=UPI0020C3C4BB|nr:alpha/beta fold hydrolase [Dyadobacter diqingensis]
MKRPQEPKGPYSYVNEEVKFQNTKANITLAGTLTLPSKGGKYPAVVLITGSGAQNRDEEVLGHKPFLVIADHLTKNGIAVLRFDDRGVGQSSGNFKTATSLDFSTDVESAVAYLQTRKEIDKSRIGLIGHSEGGLVAPLVASGSDNIRFMVLLAAPAIDLGKLLLKQDELIARSLGISEPEIQKMKNTNASAYSLIAKSTDLKVLRNDLAKLAKKEILEIPPQLLPPKMTKEEFIATQIDNLSSPWFQYVMKYNPGKTLEKVRCPVLALNGEKDLQVTSKENLSAITRALKDGGNSNIITKEFPNLNHFFQECETGSPLEYAKIEQTFSPKVLTEISTWILAQVR